MQFFLCFEGQKNLLIFFENIVASALKSCIKRSLKIYEFLFLNLIMNFKWELSQHKSLLYSILSIGMIYVLTVTKIDIFNWVVESKKWQFFLTISTKIMLA